MSMRKPLYCFECYDQTEHSVLKTNLYRNDEDKLRVRASAICTKCKTEQVVDTSAVGWQRLKELENTKDWGI